MNKTIFMLFFLLIFFHTLSFADNNKIMKVGFEDFPPSATMKNGKATGIDVEILEAAMSAVGVKVEFNMYPWNRCMMMFEKEELDAVIPMVYSEERARKYSLGSSMRTRKNVIILRKDIDITVNKLEDLKGMTIAIGKGYAVNKDFDAAGYINKEEVVTSGKVYEVLVKKVASKRADGAVVDLDVLLGILKNSGLKEKIIVTNIVYQKETHVGFIKNSSFYSKYEKGIKIIRENGVLKKIMEKWDIYYK